MSHQRTRLDRFIAQSRLGSKADVRLWIAQSKIKVDGVVAKSVQQLVDSFSHIAIAGKVLPKPAKRYIMLYKPVGFLSAAQDAKHPVVMSLIPTEFYQNTLPLHLVGRLDLHSSGLLLLTNDGLWSQNVTEFNNNVSKVYKVILQNPIDEATIQGFAQGLYFAYENSVTRPAQLEKVSTYVVRVTLWDGRFHQIKRMFKHFGNRVMALHRIQVGPVILDKALLPGQFRLLTQDEVDSLSKK